MDWRAIGKRIRQQREFMGLTREQFAEQIDVTPKFCSDIEAGVKGMSVPTLCRIAKVLRLSTDYILWGKSGQENPDSVMMVLENCTERERSYAEQLLKIFVVAMNGSDDERFSLLEKRSECHSAFLLYSRI